MDFKPMTGVFSGNKNMETLSQYDIMDQMANILWNPWLLPTTVHPNLKQQL